MALAAGVSPRLRPSGPRSIGRQGGPRGFLLTGCSRPDCIPGGRRGRGGPLRRAREGDGSMVNGEGKQWRGSQAATPLTPGDGRARGAGRSGPSHG